MVKLVWKSTITSLCRICKLCSILTVLWNMAIHGLTKPNLGGFRRKLKLCPESLSPYSFLRLLTRHHWYAHQFEAHFELLLPQQMIKCFKSLDIYLKSFSSKHLDGLWTLSKYLSSCQYFVGLTWKVLPPPFISLKWFKITKKINKKPIKSQ